MNQQQQQPGLGKQALSFAGNMAKKKILAILAPAIPAIAGVALVIVVVIIAIAVVFSVMPSNDEHSADVVAKDISGISDEDFAMLQEISKTTGVPWHILASVSKGTSSSGGLAHMSMAPHPNTPSDVANCPETGMASEQGLTHNALTMMRCVKSAFPTIATIHGLGQRPIGVGGGDHENGRAVDFMTSGASDYASPTSVALGKAIRDWVIANAKTFDVNYVIYYDKIYIASSDFKEKPYIYPGNANPTITERHLDHVHVSINNRLASTTSLTNDVSAVHGVYPGATGVGFMHLSDDLDIPKEVKEDKYSSTLYVARLLANQVPDSENMNIYRGLRTEGENIGLDMSPTGVQEAKTVRTTLTKAIGTLPVAGMDRQATCQESAQETPQPGVVSTATASLCPAEVIYERALSWLMRKSVPGCDPVVGITAEGDNTSWVVSSTKGEKLPMGEVQKRNATAIINAAGAKGATAEEIQTALMTAIVETKLKNVALGNWATNSSCPGMTRAQIEQNRAESQALPHDGLGGDCDSVGLFQQRTSWGPVSVRMDPPGATGLFLDRLFTLRGSAMSLGKKCQKVQVSAFPEKYAYWENAAKEIMMSLGGGQVCDMGTTGAPNAGTPHAGAEISLAGWAYPLAQKRTFTSGWGPRSLGYGSTYHLGVDLGSFNGEPVLSVANGVVVAKGIMPGAGNYLYIEHAGGITSGYKHLQSMMVSVGDSVSAGQQVATSGNTSGLSTAYAPHLHLEIATVKVKGVMPSYVRQNFTDPLPFFKARGIDLKTGAVS